MEIRATPYGIRHVMSRDFRKLLERMADSKRQYHAAPEDIREALSLLVAIWLPKPSRLAPSLLSQVETSEQLDEFIAANRKVIDSAIKGLVD
jgi:hypothetical protein